MPIILRDVKSHCGIVEGILDLEIQIQILRQPLLIVSLWSDLFTWGSPVSFVKQYLYFNLEELLSSYEVMYVYVVNLKALPLHVPNS